jgi:hypothetical protein
MLFLCIFLLTGSNRYAPDGRAYGHPRTEAWGWLGCSCGVAYHGSILSAIGRFVITLGLAGTFAAPLTCLGGTFDGGYAVGRNSCTLPIQNFDDNSDNHSRNPELT